MVVISIENRAPPSPSLPPSLPPSLSLSPAVFYPQMSVVNYTVSGQSLEIFRSWGGADVFVSILPSDKYEFSVFSLTWSVNLERYYTVLYAEVRERTSA